MLIVSWNVAGLSTTANRIYESYGNSASKKKASAVLAEYLNRHGADIFAVQEAKIPLSQLSTRSEPLRCSNIEGYESFWSCCVDSSKRGFNGVVTYVKKGMVISANSKPLGSPDLDEQGRCVMTDHGKFVLFNVYVPAGGGQPLRYKMKFLNALRRAMKEQRRRQKKVILVGDLNISHTKLDKFWSDRVLFIQDILQEMASSSSDNDVKSKWKVDLAQAWPKIEAALKTKEVVKTKTTNSLNNKQYDKFRMTVQVDGKKVFLGSHETDPGYCEHYYDFQKCTYTCDDAEECVLAEEDNVVCISVVAELMSKIVGIRWDEQTQRAIAATAGNVSRVSPPRKWLNAIIQEDEMVDAFRLLYPTAEGRYTCWHQFTNKRYTNEGARIDFTLVDKSIVKYIQRGNVDSLRCCSSQEEANCEAAALCAVTANGAFEPVSFQGGGIIEARIETLDTQFGIPHTGMIYTPPSFSDHIAISVLLDDDIASRTLELHEQDPATRKAQPHKSQKSIASFFTSPSSTCTKKQLTSKTRKVFSSTRQKPKGIQNFFSVKTAVKSHTEENSKITPANVPEKRTLRPQFNESTIAKRPRSSILNHFSQKK